jgi:subtilisin family serine protease
MSLEISPQAMDPSSSNYRLVKTAVDYAASKSVLLVAAGGNSAPPRGDGTVWYPARFSSVVAVAALTVNNTKASYGPEGVELDLAAPGGDATDPVLSTWPSSSTVRAKCANFDLRRAHARSGWRRQSRAPAWLIPWLRRGTCWPTTCS